MYIYSTFLDYFLFTLLSISTLLHFWKQRELFVFFNFASLYLKLKCPSALLQSGFGVSYLYHHFYLKPTKCAKGTTESNPQRCPFRNDRVSAYQKGEAFISNLHTVLKTSTAYLWFFKMFSITSQPLMDCAVCYKTADDQIESIPKPYVHCIQKPRLTEVFMSCLVITSLCDEKLYEQETFQLTFKQPLGSLWVFFF